jgi:hypothetical protein
MRVAIIENGIITNIIQAQTLEEAIAIFPNAVCLNVDGVFCDIGWTYINGVLSEPVVIISLGEAIFQVQVAIQDYAQTLLSAAVEGASSEERDTWFGKKDEARKYFISNDPLEAPNLQIEADAAGIPILVLATIVRDKAAVLSAYTSHLCGNRTYHYTYVATLTEVDDVLNYDYSIGWIPA